MILISLVLAFLSTQVNAQYQPNWKSLDSRPLPQWYDEAKIGIFLHWGLYSVPGYGSEWMWNNWNGGDKEIQKFMNDNFRPNFTYQDFGSQFTAEFYDPDQWADLFKDAGAKYVVLTSKHHEGFTMWPSKYSWNWNAKDLGANRDLLGDLAASVRKRTDLHFGAYYSLYEWYHPLYRMDKANNFTTQIFVHNKMRPEMEDLVNTYKPEVLWVDGDWEANATYFDSLNFLTWLYNKSPVKDCIAVNDRWGKGIPCHHGGYYSCDDRFNPGILQEHKWENAMTVDLDSWGYQRNTKLSGIMTIEKLIATLAQTISCGGNLLMNVGPTHDGRIIPIFEERLRQVGSWLKVNGEAIYKSKPWKIQNDSLAENVWYTNRPDLNSTYAIMLTWPANGFLQLGLGADSFPITSDLTMLGVPGALNYNVFADSVQIQLPRLVSANDPSKWAWVLKFTHPDDSDNFIK